MRFDAPFRYRLNAPETLLKTANDPNRHTFTGTQGTLHSYDACSDPYVAFDSEGDVEILQASCCSVPCVP